MIAEIHQMVVPRISCSCTLATHPNASVTFSTQLEVAKLLVVRNTTSHGRNNPDKPGRHAGIGANLERNKSNLNKCGSLEPTKHNRKRVCATRNRAAAWEEPKEAAAHQRQAQADVTCGAARASWESHRGKRGTAGAQVPGRPGTSTAPQGGQGRGRGASAWETQAPAPANLSQGRPKASPLGGQRRRRN